MNMLKVVVATVDAAWKRELRSGLQCLPGIELSEVQSPSALLLRADAAALDVLLLDEHFHVDIAAYLRSLLQRHPDIRTLMLSDHCTAISAGLALKSGARGCLLRTGGPQEWAKAIQVVAAGEIWVRRELLSEILARTLSTEPPYAISLRPTDEALTEREQEIVDAVVHGLSNKQIANALHISDTTVKTHLHHVYAKLNVQRRTQLLRLAPA